MIFQDYLIESWKDYKLSTSPKVLLYDFYVLGYISSIILDPGIRKNIGLTGVGYSGVYFGREGKELDEDIQNAQRKLLPFLGNKLSQALFIGICAEMGNVLAEDQKWSKFKYTENRTFKKFIKNLKLMNSRELKDFQSKRNIENPELETNESDYKIAYQAVKKAIIESKGNVVDFARMAAEAFRVLRWRPAYGGKNWGLIAEGYIKLRLALDNYKPETPSPYAKSAAILTACIDHAFSLQHNTGTVLNKVKYFDVNGYSWIKKALDDKKQANMYIIASKASSDMRKLGLEVFKVEGIQNQQLKKTPADAGIPAKKIKLAGFTSKKKQDKNEGKNIKDPSSLPTGRLLTDEYNEFVAEVLEVNNTTQKVKIKFIAAKNQNDEKWLGKTHTYTFTHAKAYLHMVKKQDEAVLLKDYFVDPSYKPGATSSSSKFQVGDVVKMKDSDGIFGEIIAFNQTPSANLYNIKITSSNVQHFNAGDTLFNIHERELELSNKENDPAEKIQVGDIVKLKGFGPKEVFARVIKAFNNTVEDVYNVMVTSSKNPNISVGTIFYGQTDRDFDKEKVPDKSVPSETFKIGDTVKAKNHSLEGIVINIINNNVEDDDDSQSTTTTQIQITKANSKRLIGVKTWYPSNMLEKTAASYVVKLQGFGGKKASKPTISNLATPIEHPYMLSIGSILFDKGNINLYKVEQVNGPENYVRLKLVATNQYNDNLGNYVELNGEIIKSNFKLVDNKYKRQAYAAYEYNDFTTASRAASKAANAGEPVPRERDDSDLEVGNYYVISNETLIVQITRLPRGYVEYLIIAGDKKHKRLQGQRSGMPEDMFVDSVNFALETGNVPEYIEKFKNKRGSR